MSAPDRFAPLKVAWTERTSREQILVASAGALLAGVLAWYAILSPALGARDQARSAHARAVESFETMVAGVARYRAEIAASDQPQSTTALRTVVGTSAAERELALSRVQPLEDGRLGVWLENASDDALMAWLLALARDEGIRVDQISIDREGDRLVRAQMVLTRGGGS